MPVLERVTELLAQEAEWCLKEIDCLTQRRQQERRRLLATQQLLKALRETWSQQPQVVQAHWFPESVVRKQFIAWLPEYDPQLKGLLQKRGARTRLRKLLAENPELTYGELLRELQHVP